MVEDETTGAGLSRLNGDARCRVEKIGRASRMVRLSNMSELVIELVRVFAVGNYDAHVALEAYEFVGA